MSPRSRGLLFPVVLIAVGVAVLLVNIGVVPAVSWQRLGDLWPLILVMLGIQLVLNHSLPRARAQVAGLVAAVVVVVAALAYATLGPAVQTETQLHQTSDPRSGLSAPTVELRTG